MAAKFSIIKDRTGKYRFNLKSSNGEIIAASESYPDKKSALKGIAAIVKAAPIAKISDDTGEEVIKRSPGRPAGAKNKTAATKKTVAKPRGRPAAAKVKTAAKPRGRKPIKK